MHYFKAYGKLPILLRAPASPAFLQAIADAVKLSASQFDTYALIKAEDSAQNLNFLMKLALEKLPFLAFAKSLEEWRWAIFDKSTAVSYKNFRFIT